METFDPETEIPFEYSIYLTPWLRGWDPLMDWMDEVGIGPRYCPRFRMIGEGVVEADIYEQDEHGRPIFDRELDRVRFQTERFSARRPPPYRTPSGTILA